MMHMASCACHPLYRLFVRLFFGFFGFFGLGLAVPRRCWSDAPSFKELYSYGVCSSSCWDHFLELELQLELEQGLVQGLKQGLQQGLQQRLEGCRLCSTGCCRGACVRLLFKPIGMSDRMSDRRSMIERFGLVRGTESPRCRLRCYSAHVPVSLERPW